MGRRLFGRGNDHAGGGFNEHRIGIGAARVYSYDVFFHGFL
jgi:hypothetical protein